MLDWAREFAGLSMNSIRGFRFPFRKYTKDGINLLSKLGFDYDSSMATTGAAQAMWPYTLDNGAVSECDGMDSLCGQKLNAPGLWEVPLAGSVGPEGPHLMDPYNDYNIFNPITPKNASATLLNTFNQIYSGNRAPFGLYTHPLWLGKAIPPNIPDGTAKLEAMNYFLDQAMSMPDVWMVTTSQLIQYMRNPVDASELGAQSYMQCNERPPTNICNGVTLTKVETCDLITGTIRTCYGCPVEAPSLKTPVPQRVKGNKRCAVPGDCNPLYWDPIACQCVCSPNCAPWYGYKSTITGVSNWNFDGSPAIISTGINAQTNDSVVKTNNNTTLAVSASKAQEVLYTIVLAALFLII